MVPKVLAEAYNYKASSDCLGALHDIKLRIMITFIQLQSSDRQYNKQVIKFKRYVPPIFELQTPNHHTQHTPSLQKDMTRG